MEPLGANKTRLMLYRVVNIMVIERKKESCVEVIILILLLSGLHVTVTNYSDWL